MPQSLSIGAFVFGAVLVLLSLVVGKFKLFGAEVDGTVGKAGRVIAFLFGVFLISTSLNLNHDQPSPQGSSPQPATTQTISNGGRADTASVVGPAPREESPAPPSLTQKFEDYLVGTWQARAADPNTGIVMTSETQFFNNGNFSGMLSGLINGYPQSSPFAGTWSVSPLSANRFSLTLNYVGAGSQTQTFRVIDHNSSESAAGVVAHRIAN
jgi:hypothetical protein